MTRATNEKAPLAGGAFSESQTKSVQRNSSVDHGDSQGPLSKYQLLWLAPMPAPRKLVAMAMAYHSDDDGRNITCSYLTVGTMSGMKPQQVGRHVDDLVNTGVLKLERKAVQHHPARYTLDLATLSDLSLKATLDPLRVALKGRSRTLETLQGRLLRSPDLPLKATYPPHPSGERERSAGEPPTAAPEYPDNWPWAEWNELVATGRPQSALARWKKQGRDFLKAGGDCDALAEQFTYLTANPRMVQLRVGVVVVKSTTSMLEGLQ
jgi:hypothetical protein